ncbi:MAG: TIGR02281 family clan AA aspartic protease [Gammaproteobacteria bacterium]|nr:TIGR02281 family clan AA aspartic protease [Gammaproteobacteria bacterium]
MKAHDSKSKMGWGMLLAMWAIIFSMLAWFFSGVLDRQNNPNQSISTNYISDQVLEVVLQRNRFGHYVTYGQINGVKAEFMLDTGATGVVIPEHMASSLGLKRGAPVIVQTANGNLQAYAVKLEKVSIGDITLHDIKALLNPAEKTDVILLGMSFLKYIEFTQRGDVLILRQYVGES